MSVIVTIRISGDPARLEQHAAAHPDEMRAIADRASARGLIAHRFYGSDDGQIMVIDEWPDAESFQGFFDEASPEISSMLGEAGVTSQPEATFWRELETADKVGWGA
jgi:heme-degrading monooxygenase HmoA